MSLFLSTKAFFLLTTLFPVPYRNISDDVVRNLIMRNTSYR